MDPVSGVPNTSETLEDKLTRLRADKAKLEKSRQDALDAREIEFLELEARLESELGPRGSAFELIDAGADGLFAVKRGEAVLYTRFQSKPGAATLADLSEYVLPCVVYPVPSSKYSEVTFRVPAIAQRCAMALNDLYGAKKVDNLGKF